MSAATRAMRTHDAEITARLLLLLGQDADWLFSRRLDAGLHWLDTRFGPITPDHHGPRETVAASALFWAWWNNQWANRDEHLAERLTVEQLNGGDRVLAYRDHPDDALASRLLHQPSEFRAFYDTHHRVMTAPLVFDYELLRIISRDAKLKREWKADEKPAKKAN